MVEEGTVSEAEALARKHPIAAFSLDALTAGAAKLRPNRLALTEAGPGGPTRALTYREFDAQVRAVAQHLADLGLAPGERILIIAGARAACIVATIAALAAGIEPLLVPVGVDGTELGAIANSAGCVAIAGPTSYGPLSLEEALFEAAANSETVRCVATLGPGATDGAIDLAPERLALDSAKSPRVAEIRPRIGTLSLRREPVFHEQSVLLAAALDLVGTAEIAAGSQIFSTLSPASFAGLVTGPVASLLSGAPLTLFGPFDAAGFLALLDRIGANHCVFPAAILPDLERAGLLREDTLASAIAIVREEATLAVEADCPLIEVHALEESGIIVRHRARADSQSAPILSGEVLAPVPPVRPAERSWR
jgi:acyl-CoA synthetase (AMP-forming)/AMP-acid ligase II